MVIIKEINPVEFGKTLLIVQGTMGLVFGLFTTLASFMGFSMSRRLGIFSLIFGRQAVLSLPLFYGISGYLIGRIAAGLFNTLIGSKKGLSVEVLR